MLIKRSHYKHTLIDIFAEIKPVKYNQVLTNIKPTAASQLLVNLVTANWKQNTLSVAI